MPKAPPPSRVKTMNLNKPLLAFVLCLLAGLAQAQNVITFSTNVSQAGGSATPTLTWSTQPAAASCTASGDWSGAKFASGTETLPTTATSKTYNLTCTWPADRTAVLTWTPATKNTDGSNYTDPASVLIRYGVGKTAAQALDLSVSVPVPATTTTFNDLIPGVWSFEAISVNQAAQLSAPTGRVTKTVLADLADTETVGVTVNPRPLPPSGLAVQ